MLSAALGMVKTTTVEFGLFCIASNAGFKLRAAQDVLGRESPAPTVSFKPQLDPERFR